MFCFTSLLLYFLIFYYYYKRGRKELSSLCRGILEFHVKSLGSGAYVGAFLKFHDLIVLAFKVRWHNIYDSTKTQHNWSIEHIFVELGARKFYT